MDIKYTSWYTYFIYSHVKKTTYYIQNQTNNKQTYDRLIGRSKGKPAFCHILFYIF